MTNNTQALKAEETKEPWFQRYTMDIEGGPFSHINANSSFTDKASRPKRLHWRRDVLQDCGMLIDQGLMPTIK